MISIPIKISVFKNANIITKMIVFVIIMSVLSAGIAGYGLFDINNLSNEIHTVHNTYWPEANDIKQLEFTINSQINDLRSYELNQSNSKSHFLNKINVVNSYLSNISKKVGSSNNDLELIAYNYKEIITLATGAATGIFDLTDSYHSIQITRLTGYQNFIAVHEVINNILTTLEHQAASETGHNNSTISELTLELNIALWNAQNFISNAMIETNNSKIDVLKNNFMDLLNGTNNNESIANRFSTLANYLPSAIADNSTSPQATTYLNDAKELTFYSNSTNKAWQSYITAPYNNLMSSRKSENTFYSQRNALLSEIDSYVTKMDSSLTNIENISNQRFDTIASSTTVAFTTMVLLSILLSVIGVIIGIFFARSIANPIKKVSKISEKLSKGDLTQSINAQNRSDELGKLQYSFSEMTSFLSNIITRISHLSNTLATSAEEMAASSEEVTSSAQEISTMTQQMSKGAQEQTLQITDTLHNATNLQIVFEEKVRDINSTATLIESISGQVNMLALNASIEAARAGEYGRGFSIVADNIRRLAEDTNNSVEKVQSTISSLSTSLTGSINNIIASVSKISVVAEQTASGTEETSAATEQQTAVMEELTASAQDLSSIASQLDQLIANFTL